MSECKEMPQEEGVYKVELVNRPGELPAFAKIYPDGRSVIYEPLSKTVPLLRGQPSKADDEEVKGCEIDKSRSKKSGGPVSPKESEGGQE